MSIKEPWYDPFGRDSDSYREGYRDGYNDGIKDLGIDDSSYPQPYPPRIRPAPWRQPYLPPSNKMKTLPWQYPYPGVPFVTWRD